MNRLMRVVVTGIGAVTPLGVGAVRSWERLLAGHSGIVKLVDESYDKMPARVAARVPLGKGEYEFDMDRFPKSDWRQMSQATAFALVAAEEALLDANWKPQTDYDLHTTGVSVGTGMIDLNEVVNTGAKFAQSGHKAVSPYFIPKVLPNMISGFLAIRYGFKGPNHCVSTACTTGLHSVGDAFMMIQRGQARVMLCGSSEACISPLSVAGFCRVRALCTKFNGEPEEASRPFDCRRDGFVMGEGSGMLVLEEMEHALQRNAKIYAEILGYGLSGDGYHLTTPCPDGAGAKLSMRRALNDAGLRPSDIGYFNAHATSTKQGDDAEISAIYEVTNDSLQESSGHHPIVSSCKGAIGHLLGAAGSVETIFTLLSCYYGIVPPNRNLIDADVPNVMNFSPKDQPGSFESNRQNNRRMALKNSFGFWGANASLCLANMNE